MIERIQVKIQLIIENIQLTDQNDGGNKHLLHKRKRKDRKTIHPSTIHRSLVCLILSGLILTVFIILYIDNIPWHLGHKVVDHIAKSFGYDKPVHGVVIDAGSTGSRVLAFTFHEAYLDGHLVLDNELFEYTKPGLSSFADTPSKAVESIATLIEKAQNEIPEKYWSKTPLILRATAGLRLLPSHKAENLLNAVKDYISKTPFLTTNDSVDIMDGTDEGIFSWFTVNFLLNRLNNPVKSVAALDLGGGSTQVTFSALTPASLKQREYIHSAVAPNGVIQVYTHSYLGLGLMMGRKEIITYNQPNEVNVTSICVNPIIRGKKFHFGGEYFHVSGLQKNYPVLKDKNFDVSQDIPIVSFEDCSKIVIDYVKSRAKPPEELLSKQIFAFSYYFDRAAEVGLIDEYTGGQVEVQQFKAKAEIVCKEANIDQPFMCLDLTFIWALLEKGLGLRPETKLFLYKKILSHEISWALGQAYSVLRGKDTSL